MPRQNYKLSRKPNVAPAARSKSIDTERKITAAKIRPAQLSDTPDIKARSIELLPPTAIRAAPSNARKHSDRQLTQIAASIRCFGFTNPILIDEAAELIAGHGRLEAARRLGLAQVPVIRIEGLSEAERRVLRIADNRIAENSSWDLELLATELRFLSELKVDFELELSGISTAEMDSLIGDKDAADTAAEDEVPLAGSGEAAVSRAGDVWKLGGHALICGDARDAGVLDRLMGAKRAHMTFSDPPYNVAIDGHARGLGRVHHREFAMASGEMSTREFRKFLDDSLRQLARVSVDGSIHYLCMDWRHIADLIAVGNSVYSEFKNLAVWVKENAGMGSFYRSQHELVAIFKHGKAPHLNNFGLGETGRYRSNVWTYAGVNSFKKNRGFELDAHPTVKPVALVMDAIKDVTRRGQIVLDGFCGSGTTIIAAERTGRLARAVEIDPAYVDVAVRRWETLTGETARLSDGNRTVAETARIRNGRPCRERVRGRAA